MTRDDSLINLLTDWLEEQPARAPDRLLDSVLTDLQTAPQRARWRLAIRRFTMPGSNLVRYGAVAGVAALAVIIGLGLWAGAGRPIGPPGGTSTPAPTASMTPTTPVPATAVPSPVALSEQGPLAPGSYFYQGDGVRVTLTVPAGWESNASNGVATSPAREGPDGLNFSFHQPALVYDDPCRPDAGSQLAGSTVDDLVTTLAGIPHADVTPPTDATIDGFQGKHLAWTIETEGIDCVMALWGDGSFIRAAETGQHQDVWIQDVAGALLLIDAATFPETSDEDRAALQAVIDSLEIEATD